MYYKSDTKSKFYPYFKVQEGYYDLSSNIDVPRKIMAYLLDMPQDDYTPIDDNSYPRVRLWKYLYYDEANPLTKALPTPRQKKEVLFNPDNPEKPKNTSKGYRLFPLFYVKPSQESAQTRIYVALGRKTADTDFKIQQSVVFNIWTHYTLENNTKADESYSRLQAISQAIMEAFHGVNMDGVGTFYFNRSKHPDCSEVPQCDNDNNIGIRLTLAYEIASETQGREDNNGIPFVMPNGAKLIMG